MYEFERYVCSWYFFSKRQPNYKRLSFEAGETVLKVSDQQA